MAKPNGRTKIILWLIGGLASAMMGLYWLATTHVTESRYISDQDALHAAHEQTQDVVTKIYDYLIGHDYDHD